MIIVRKIKAYMELETNILVLGLTSLAYNTLLNSWMMFFPLYIEQIGGDIIQVGTTFTLSYLLASLIQTPAGHLADRYGRKKLVWSSALVSGSCWIIVGFANAWVPILLSLITAFIFDAVSQPALLAMISESVQESKRGTAFGSFWTFTALSLVVAPLVGGFLIPVLGYKPFIFVTALLNITNSGLRFALLRETFQAKGLNREKPKLTSRFSSSAFFMVAGSLIFSLGSGLFNQYVPIFAEKSIRLTLEQIGLMFSVSNLASFLMSFPVGKIADKIEKKTSVAIGWISSSMLIIIWAYSLNPAVAIGSYGVSGGLASFYVISFSALAADLSPQERRAMFMGIISTVNGVVYSLGIFIGGVIWTTYHPITPFVAGALTSLPAAIIIYVLVKEPRS